MTQHVYLASPEGANGRNLAAYALLKAMSARSSVGIFRPLVSKSEVVTEALIELGKTGQQAQKARGMCPCRASRDEATSRGDIVSAFYEAKEASKAEQMLIVGSDNAKVFDPHRFDLNCAIAADLQAVVFLAVCTIPRDAHQLRRTIEACTRSVEAAGSSVAGVFITGCTEEKAQAAREVLADWPVPVWTIAAGTLPNDELSLAEQEAQAQEAISNVDLNEVLAAIDAPFNVPTTPYAFQYSLLAKAKAHRKTIVLPEGEEDRIIKAADFLLQRDIVDLIIVGERESILQRGRELGLEHLAKATIQSMNDEQVLEPMTAKLCELRAKKGLTPEQAREQLKDPSYFGTMLVVLGKADGLVSGSVNSTANTVRPALQVIKTKPGASLVSGAFLMCLKDRMVVFADCAINLNPNAEQLADIAIQSAQTAQAFGLDPHVGMLSYSTLGSGKGPDVDLVEEATKIVQTKAPEIKVVGSIQFDAAWSPTVAATKAKGNDIAGKVNVFVFPDLCAGNIAYKAVQRTSGALAIGPVLQGLNSPVNDLSRGALVEDIVNTVALTAVTAQ